MFHYQQPPGGQIVDLTTLRSESNLLLKRELTGFTVGGTMEHHFLRSRHLHQGMALMAHLTTRRPPTFVLLFAWFAAQPIAGRRFTAIVTIFAQSPFEFFDAQQGTHKHPFELFDPTIFLLGVLFDLSVGFLEPSHFFFGHALSLPALSSPFEMG